MKHLKQSTAYNLTVLMVDSTDHITGKTGLTLTITASKAGAAFGAITPTVTELATGWYKLELTTAHTDTLGDLDLHITATGADPTDVAMQVYANTYDTLATPTNITGGVITTVTNLTNLPAVTTDWLTAAGVKADAVTKIQTGLALEATLTAIKGAGWSTETLAAIDVLIDAIKAKTDTIPANPAAVGSEVALNSTAVDNLTSEVWSEATRSLTDKADFTLTSDYDTAKDDVLTPLATVDTVVDAIKAKTDNLPASPAAVGSQMALNSTAVDNLTSEVWAEATRALTDKADFALTSAYDAAKTAASSTSVATVISNLAVVDGNVDDIEAYLSTNLDMQISDIVTTVAVSSTEAASVATGVMDMTVFYTLEQTVNSTSDRDLSSATKLWFAVKDIGDTDANSLVFLEKTGGLTVVNKTTYATTSHGSLILTGSAGDWDITVMVGEQATALLTSFDNRYFEASLKALVDGDAIPVWDGECRITNGVIRTLA